MRSLALAFLLCMPSFGQIVTGTIAGRAVDPSALPVAGVQLELTQTTTGRSRSASTSPAGEFVFSGLESGTYTLTALKDGFKRLTRQNVVLDSGQRLVLGDLIFELGNVAETITVQAEVAGVATQSADRSDLITNQQVARLLTGAKRDVNCRTAARRRCYQREQCFGARGRISGERQSPHAEQRLHRWTSGDRCRKRL